MREPSVGKDFSEASTRLLLEEACGAVGLDASDAELMRLGENAIYSLASAPVVVRIARSLTALDDVRKEVRVARWLAYERVPAVRLAAETGTEPLIVSGRYPVTFWELVHAADPPPGEADLALLLRQIHDLAPPGWVNLPDFDRFARVADRLNSPPPATDKTDTAFLAELFDELQTQYSQLSFVFPPGPIHGDAYLANLLRTESGDVVMLDFESFAFGPREWDLAITGARRDGFGWLTAEEYRDFVDAYGYDILTWPGFRVLRAIRELTMTTWLMQLVDDPPAATFADYATTA